MNGKVGVGTSITSGHSLLPPLRQHGGVHKTGKSHKNEKNGIKNGKAWYNISKSSFYMMNLFKSDRTISDLLRNTCTFVVFFQGFRLQAIAIPV